MGVVGEASPTGVLSTGVLGRGQVGIKGEGDSVGVVGRGGDGGVYGDGRYVGVTGFSTEGVGVDAYGDVGVRTESAETALLVRGKARFSRSGKTSIGAGLTKKDVSMGKLSAATLVTATVQGAPISGLHVASVHVQPSLNKFTIYLSKAVPSGKTATVGWFVVN